MICIHFGASSCYFLSEFAIIETKKVKMSISMLPNETILYYLPISPAHILNKSANIISPKQSL